MSKHLMVVKFNSDGSVNQGSGEFGIQLENIGSIDGSPVLDERLDDIAIDSQGRVLALLSSWQRDLWFVLRLTASGEVDQGFGSGGVYSFPFNIENSPVHTDLNARGQLLVDSNDRVLIGIGRITSGRWSLGSWGPAPGPKHRSRHYIEMRRLDSSGTLDVSFGDGGIVEKKFSPLPDARLVSIRLDNDERIVVGATVGHLDTEEFRFGGLPDPQFGVMRFLQNGAVDTSFGLPPLGDQVVHLPLPPGAYRTLAGLNIDSSGRPFVFGSQRSVNAFARLTLSGALDSSFNGIGFIIKSEPDLRLAAGDLSKFESQTEYGRHVFLNKSMPAQEIFCLGEDGETLWDIDFARIGGGREAFGVTFTSANKILIHGRTTNGLFAMKLQTGHNSGNLYVTADPFFVQGGFAEFSYPDGWSASQDYLAPQVSIMSSGEIIMASTIDG